MAPAEKDDIRVHDAEHVAQVRAYGTASVLG